MNVALACFFFLVEVQFLFPTFIDFCKQSMRNTDNSPDSLPQGMLFEIQHVTTTQKLNIVGRKSHTNISKCY